MYLYNLNINRIMLYTLFCGHSWNFEVQLQKCWAIWVLGKSVGWDRILGPLVLECSIAAGCITLTFISVTGAWNSSPKDHGSWVAHEEKTWLLYLTATLVSSCRIQCGFFQSKVVNHIPLWELGCCPWGRHSRLAAVSLQRELGTRILLLGCCIHVLFFWQETVYWS